MNKRQRAYKRGVYAEYWAMFCLILKGYRILKHRYKTKVGEIDIMAYKNNALIAVEVKAYHDQAAALYAISKKAQNRIARAVQYFMMEHPKYVSKDIRFDVLSIKMWGVLPVSILHLDNAWCIDS
jgi:putative endonuclease